MKNIFIASLFIAILSFIDCTLRAQSVNSLDPQWIETNCPFSPNALCIHDRYLFVGYDGGVVRTSDDGNTWEPANNGLHGDMTYCMIYAICSAGNNIIAGASGFDGSYISTNNGNSWTRQNGAGVSDIVSFCSHNAYIFASSANSNISRSSDNGNSWIVIDSGFYDPLHYGALTRAVTANNNFVFCCTEKGEIYRSDNDGDLWSLIYQAHELVYTVFAKDSVIFAQTQHGILRSFDNGASWQPLPDTNISANAFIAIDNKILIGGNGVSISLDNGNSWENISTGLPDSVIISAFIIHDSILFAGGYIPSSLGTIWRIPISDITNSVRDVLSKSLNIYPNPAQSAMRISYSIPKHSNVVLNLFDITGKELSTIASEEHDGGSYETIWDSRTLPSGSYILKLTACGESVTKVVEVVK